MAAMIVGLIIFILILAVPVLFYIYANKEDIDWEKVGFWQYLKRYKRVLIILFTYIAVVTVLNSLGVIEATAFELFFRYWGVPLLILGYRCAWDRTSDGFIAATILLFFGLIGSGIIIANVHLYIAISIIVSIPLSLMGCYIFRDKSQWR